MSDKSDNNQEENINYNSKDIRKKDLKFNVKEDDSAKVTESLKQVKQKIVNSPIIKGKNKFITLGVIVFVITAAITLPIILPRVLNSADSPTNGNTQDEDEQEKVKQEISDVVNSVDAESSDEAVDTVISEIDEQIRTGTTEDRLYYVPVKATVLARHGNYLDAAATIEPIIDEQRASKSWDVLKVNCYFIAMLYRDAGNTAKAIEWLKAAIAVIDEAATDPEKPAAIVGKDYYQSEINKLESQQ